MSVTCPYCGKQAVLVDSIEVYRTRSYGMVWLCRPCKAWVGCHKTGAGHKPLGRLADKELREAKMRAHKAFDPLWRSGMFDRRDAYAWLADELGIARDECHIGMFDVEQCRRVVEVCTDADIAKLKNRPWSPALKLIASRAPSCVTEDGRFFLWIASTHPRGERG